jgi:hypothetical protein
MINTVVAKHQFFRYYLIQSTNSIKKYTSTDKRKSKVATQIPRLKWRTFGGHMEDIWRTFGGHKWRIFLHLNSYLINSMHLK